MITKFKIFEKKYTTEEYIINVKCNWCDWYGNNSELDIVDNNDFSSDEICPNCSISDYLMDIDINELIGDDFIEYMKNHKFVNNIKREDYNNVIDYYKALYPLYFESKKYNL